MSNNPSDNIADEKIAIVTGGSRGIGRGICVGLARSGWTVVLSYNTNAAAAGETLAALAEAARRYSWESVAEGVIAAAQGRLDALPHPAPPADNVPAP